MALGVIVVLVSGLMLIMGQIVWIAVLYWRCPPEKIVNWPPLTAVGLFALGLVLVAVGYEDSARQTLTGLACLGAAAWCSTILEKQGVYADR